MLYFKIVCKFENVVYYNYVNKLKHSAILTEISYQIKLAIFQ